MNGLGGQYTAPVPQNAMGEPLRSEQRVGQLLPRVLSRVDMLVIFIVAIVFIPNASIVQTSTGGSAMTYLYWIIGAVTFLLPGVVATGQLNRFMPVDGGIYIWSHRALGALWGFFAGFCAWAPGILILPSIIGVIMSLLQFIGTQVSGANAGWLTQPWQQGILGIGLLLLIGWLSSFPLRLVMRIAKIVVALYGVGILMIGLAGVVWLLQGHTPAVPLTGNHSSSNAQQVALYGVIVLSLLGVEVPFNMSAETKQQNAASLTLRWGPLLVLLAYLIGTFGVMMVVPPGTAGLANSVLIAVGDVFGAPVAVPVGIIFSGFFVVAAIIYNVTFARILFVSALDHRLPISLTKLNRHATPSYATTIQLIIVLLILIFAYFIGPTLYDTDIDFSTKTFIMGEASVSIIWCISMVFLFLDLPILLRRFRGRLMQRSEQLIAPRWVLYLCCVVGGLASLLGIWTTFSASWNSALISNNEWLLLIAISTIVPLVVGLVGAAYPHLLSNLNEQTAAARENARLYNELQVAYAKLSELDQLKDAFITTASHELRTPLTIVQGYLELLGEMEDIDAETRRSFLIKAQRACDELVLLQANIMDASRIELDTATLHCTCIPLKETCMTIVELFEPLILKERRQVVVEIAPEIIVHADEIRLKQIMHNLLANALRYSPEQTPIWIVAWEEQEQHMARINVIDRGPGVPPEKQAIIFDKFVRLERDMHGIRRGSGLGLFITRQLVEAMQGTIIIESSGREGEGATFSFTLPATTATPRPGRNDQATLSM